LRVFVPQRFSIGPFPQVTFRESSRRKYSGRSKLAGGLSKRGGHRPGRTMHEEGYVLITIWGPWCQLTVINSPSLNMRNHEKPRLLEGRCTNPTREGGIRLLGRPLH
jgi:hypothetical protein